MILPAETRQIGKKNLFIELSNPIRKNHCHLHDGGRPRQPTRWKTGPQGHGAILRALGNDSSQIRGFFVCEQIQFKIYTLGTSLVAQWLRLRAPNAGDLGLIPGQGTRSHMYAATKS